MIGKKLGIIVLGCSIGLAGIGGAGVYLTSLDNPAVKLVDVEKMDESKQQAFLDELLMKVSEGGKPTEVEKMLGEKINGLSKENASEAVYLLLSSMAVEQGKQMVNYRTVGEGILSAYEDEQFESGRNKSMRNIEDKSVQGYLEELNRQHLFIEDDGEGLYLSQDLEYIESAYGNYLTETVKGVVKIRIMNQKDPYANGALTSFDMDKMMERILFIEGEKENWKDTIYEGEMVALQEEAYMDFFGVTHDTYFEEAGGKLKMKDSVVEKMYLLQAEYTNSFMGNEILGYMDELEADGFVKKDTQTFIFEQMSTRFAVDSSEQSPLVLNESGGEVQ